MTTEIRIFEVGPRDGLQNEKTIVPLDIKVALIERLAAAGLPAVEAGAFVSPKWVPQMADTGQVMDRLHRRMGVDYPVLVPNMKGYEAALAAGITEIAIFGAASETFSQKNINCSIAESLDRFRPICSAAFADGIRVRGYVSCVLGCPYEGEVDPATVADVSASLMDMGCYEISLGDTIGVGTPTGVRALIRRVATAVPADRLAAHFHDTYGMAIANITVAIDEGIRTIDSAVAGLGGCPYAKGASGNVATEDVIYLLEGEGVQTGVDLPAVAQAGAFIAEALGRSTGSKVGRAILANAAV